MISPNNWMVIGCHNTVAVTAAAQNTVIKASPGFLGNVVVTTANSGSPILFYDSATTNSGTVIGYIATTAAVATTYAFNMPAANGITVAGNGNGAFTVSYD